MLKKCIYMLVLCLISSFAIAEDKKEMKDFMQKYAKAYNSMDNKKLLEFVTPEYLNKLKWEFHDFRKMHQKPRLKLFEIVANKDKVNCVASLELNNKVKYRNKQLVFVIKNSKIQSCRKVTAPASKRIFAHDFWTAAKQADGFAVAEIQKSKSVKFIKMLANGLQISNEKVNLPRWLAFNVIKSGKYLVPVVQKQGKYIVDGYGYRLPKYKPETADNFIKQWRKFKKFNNAQETVFLKKLIKNNTNMQMTQAALNRLAVIKYFDSKLSQEDITFWKTIAFKSELYSQLKAWLITEICKRNFEAFKPVLEKILTDNKLSSTAAYQLYRHDKNNFKKQMLEWLKNDKKREFALKNSRLLTKDNIFVAEAMKYFKNSGADELKSYLPVLLAKDNAKGNKLIREILHKQPEKYRKIIPRVYIMILRSGKSGWENEILSFAEKKVNKKGDQYLIIWALAYLCKHNDKEGIEITQKYLTGIKNDKIMKQRCLNAFSFVYRKRISSFDELYKKIMNKKILKNSTKAGGEK